MAWRRKKSNESLGTSSDIEVDEEENVDEETAHLQAAFAKIKYPPPVVSMVGAVVHADGKIEGQHPVSEVPIGITPVKTNAQDKPDLVIPAAVITQKQPSAAKVATNSKTKGTHIAAGTTTKAPDGPLSLKELTALGGFLKEKQKEPLKPVAAAPVISPTNPDPEATIPTYIVQKKLAEEAEAAAEEAGKWHVTPVAILEKKLDKKKFYKLLGLWLGALPVGFIMYSLVHLVARNGLHGFLGLVVMLPIYVIWLYGIIGWIPVMLEYLKTQKG